MLRNQLGREIPLKVNGAQGFSKSKRGFSLGKDYIYFGIASIKFILGYCNFLKLCADTTSRKKYMMAMSILCIQLPKLFLATWPSP